MRFAVGISAAVFAWFGLLDYQAALLLIACVVACLALGISLIALSRSDRRDVEVAAWKDSLLVQAEEQGEAIADDLRGD